jgi:integrase
MTALEDAGHGLKLAGYEAGTIKHVRNTVKRFAVDTGVMPWEVRASDVESWILNVGATGRLVYAFRTSLKIFYRWAHGAGRIATDPTGRIRGLPKRPVPLDWAKPVATWQLWMKSRGLQATTMEAFSDYVVRLAYEAPNAGPWSLGTSDLTEWIARHKWARETARMARNAVRSFYKWAAATGQVACDPASALPPVKGVAGSRRPAPEKVISMAIANGEPRTALMLRLAAELGLRRTEIAVIRRGDLVEGDDGYWLAVHGKGSKTRHVPVPAGLAVAMIEQFIELALFPGRVNGHLSPARVGKLCTEALPNGVTLHALRHSFATRVYSNSRDLLATQQLLGHAKATTTQQYVSVSSRDLRVALEAGQR